MSDYLTTSIDTNDPAFIAFFDEVPLWSAEFGILLLRHLPLRPGIVALDIGCGTGFPLLEIAQRLGASSYVYGVDPWEAALARAQAKADFWGVSNIHLIKGDAAQIPLPDQSVDLLVSNLGINNFDDPLAVLRECYRVARPEATLALTTNLQGHMHELYAVMAEVLTEAGAEPQLAELRQHIEHRASIAGVSAMLSAANFEPTKIIEQPMQMRFADGSALLRHWFIKLGFLPAWREVLNGPAQAQLFREVETRLNQIAQAQGALCLSIPMAYIEARAQ